MSPPDPLRPVRRRRVFFIPGYDPVAPRAHRERYRREAARQADFSGHEIALSPGGPSDGYGWRVDARIEGQGVETTVEVLHWADIVRASMARGVVAGYAELGRTAWIYLSSGALFRLMRLRKGPVIAALYPVVVLLGELVLAVALGAGTGLALHALLVPVLGRFAAGVLATGLGAGIAWALLTWFRRRDPLMAWYLMHDYAFSARHRGAYPAEQEVRMGEFAERIRAALAEEVDEVLVVGHSSGAYLAVSVLADLVRAGRVPQAGPALSLLTLGQVVPMVSFLPRAGRLRADLALMSETGQAAWVDVTAPGDGCAFALCDPVAVSGVAGPGKRWPLVLSAAFSKTLSEDAWRALRWRFFERHFQYLNAFDTLPDDPAAYDFFAVTAGPRTLAARFAARKPSASRIEKAVSGYTDLAA
jgi:hypothetical protein